MAPKQLYEDETKKSVKKSEMEEVKLWHERIEIAKKEQEQWADISGAKRFVKEYKGDYGIVFHARTKKVPIPPINEVFSYVQADIATTFNRDPYISVNAKSGTPAGAALWEVISNYYWRLLKNKEELEFEIIDKDLVGYGWHKVGTDSQGKLYSKFLDWKDVVWNINSKRPPNDCQWMAHRIVWPLLDIKEKYPNAKGMEGSPNPDLDDETYKKLSYKDDIKLGVMWEIWDIRKKEILLVAENLRDRYLDDKKPWPDYIEEFPFLMYWDFVNPGSSRPMSAIAPWEPQILEEMVLMGSAINHSKRWNRQAFVKQGSIDENSLDKYERGDDGAIIVYNGDGADLKFADFGQLPTDFYLLMDRLQAIKRNINGQPEFAKGGVTKTGTRTMGELQLMQQGNEDRQSRKVDRLETHCENIARHMMAHLKANFDFEETIKITGDTPEHIIEALAPNYNEETGTVTFTPEDIMGEYDVDIKSGSTLPLDKQTKMSLLEIVGNVMAQTAGQPMSNLLVAWMDEMLKGFDIKSLKEAYQADLEAQSEAQEAEEKSQGVEEQKTMMEAAKREAQARQIAAETEITMQDAGIGPGGRAIMKQLEKPPKPEPGKNGAKKT